MPVSCCGWRSTRPIGGGFVTVNAATLIDAPRAKGSGHSGPHTGRVQGIARCYREHSLDAFVTVALGSGPPFGRGARAQWADVNLDAWTLQVQRAVQRFGGDAAARRPLLAERKRLGAALKAMSRTPEATETRDRLTRELQTVRAAFAQVKTSRPDHRGGSLTIAVAGDAKPARAMCRRLRIIGTVRGRARARGPSAVGRCRAEGGFEFESVSAGHDVKRAVKGCDSHAPNDMRVLIVAESADVRPESSLGLGG